MQGIGYALSIAGFFWYNYIKMQPAPAAAASPILPTARRGDYAAVSAKDPDARKGAL